MWKRRVLLARMSKQVQRFRFFGTCKSLHCWPYVDRRSDYTLPPVKVGLSDPRLHEACKKAWDELEGRQIEYISIDNTALFSDFKSEFINKDLCLHVKFDRHNNGKWVSAIHKGRCTVCGKKGF